ncbi:MAG: hypothetical protein B9J98_02810 [Candidatus Terraquivivens tikiterensis]|uniref:Polymerase nucleotidyl transferase domain-containing protein n=1 Tax=Candidatus Terraquivivens tikiterensis TaxID=1980982 RepID=A0A2R7Y845_9ARCH|nr:MAG: hypothetical protein B9J98_02810 [Candidatus Terraquivivens tikiterensis]
MSRESSFDIYIEEGKRLSYLFRNLRKILQDVKYEINLLLPGSEVYLFGSTAKERYTALSDVDLLVVSDVNDSEKITMVKSTLKRKYIDYPFEFHIVDRSTYERWYKRFLSEDELVKI